MAGIKDVETKIDEVVEAVVQGFGGLKVALANEVQEVIDVISAGGDTSASITKLNDLKAGLEEKFSAFKIEISNVVTPPPPPEPEV